MIDFKKLFIFFCEKLLILKRINLIYLLFVSPAKSPYTHLAPADCKSCMCELFPFSKVGALPFLTAADETFHR